MAAETAHDLARRLEGGARGRQQHAHRRALAPHALDLDLAVEAPHDAVADREAEARPYADRLRREERVEDAGQVLGRDARARVAHLDEDAARVVRVRDDADDVVLGVALGDGLRGVDDEVEEDLPEARLVGVDGRHVAELLDEPGAVPDLVPGHAQRGLEHVLDLHGAPPLLVGRAREDPEVADDLTHALGGVSGVAQLFDDLVEPAIEARLGGELAHRFRGELEVGADRGERVVDLVGDARRERADRGHAIGDEELLLQLALLGPARRVAQLALDGGAEARQAVLEDVVARAAAHGGDGRLLPDGPRHDDEGRVEPGGAQDLEGGGGVEGRHREVGEHDVPGRARQRGAQAGGGLDALVDDVVAAAPELVEDELLVVGVVLDEEHADAPARSAHVRLAGGGRLSSIQYTPRWRVATTNSS